MASRRHFGSVRKLPSGRWQASYFHLGVRHTAPTTYPAKGDALAYLATVEADILRGSWIDGSAGRVTVNTYLTEWVAGRSDLRPSTRGKYDHLARRHIAPALGSTELGRLTPAAVRAWYHDLAERHQTTADDAYRLLRAVMNTAVSDGLIGRSPCQVKGAGQVRSAERPVASIAEVASAVNALPDRLKVAALLSAWCQLRRGEVLGLQRRDIDLKRGVVRVERAWVAVMDGKPILGAPKTAAGSRSVAMPAQVAEALEAHLSAHVGPEADAWLFPGAEGQPLRPLDLNRAWKKAREAAGRPDLHWHDLRHSGLTWAAATGASVAELMRRGGHASPQAALRYQHATEDRDRALADALGLLADTQQAGALP